MNSKSIKEALIGVEGTKYAPINEINAYNIMKVIATTFFVLRLLSIVTKAYAAAGNINGNSAKVCRKS